MEHYSVLMSVYYKEKPEFLRAAMDSMWNQTIPPDDFVLVCDGPLTPELEAVIEDMGKNHAELHVIRLEKNSGLGNALNIGINYCRNELVARMDSDDISYPDRCERQLLFFHENPSVSVISGTVEEFTKSIYHIDSKRILPEKQEEILAFAKCRNPFNHPCVMYKKSAVKAVGGYQELYLLEDYLLWIRLLQSGYNGYNLQRPLLWMRTGPELYKRRSGWKYARSQHALFKYMKESGFVSQRQYLRYSVIRTIVSVVPNWLRKYLFIIILRKER